MTSKKSSKLKKKKLSPLEEKMNKITPYQQENFITCDVEYGFQYRVNIWQIIKDKEGDDFHLPEFEGIEIDTGWEYPKKGQTVYISLLSSYDASEDAPITLEDLLDATIKLLEYLKKNYS